MRPLLRPERETRYLWGVWVSCAVARLDHDLAVIGEFADRCAHCKPGSDPDGVAAMALYLRRLRGQEPSLKTGTEAGPTDI